MPCWRTRRRSRGHPHGWTPTRARLRAQLHRWPNSTHRSPHSHRVRLHALWLLWRVCAMRARTHANACRTTGGARQPAGQQELGGAAGRPGRALLGLSRNGANPERCGKQHLARACRPGRGCCARASRVGAPRLAVPAAASVQAFAPLHRRLARAAATMQVIAPQPQRWRLIRAFSWRRPAARGPSLTPAPPGPPHTLQPYACMQ
jgi:hypothetical protein